MSYTVELVPSVEYDELKAALDIELELDSYADRTSDRLHRLLEIIERATQRPPVQLDVYPTVSTTHLCVAMGPDLSDSDRDFLAAIRARHIDRG